MTGDELGETSTAANGGRPKAVRTAASEPAVPSMPAADHEVAQLEKQLRSITVAGVDDAEEDGNGGYRGRGRAGAAASGGSSRRAAAGGAGSVRAQRRKLHGLGGAGEASEGKTGGGSSGGSGAAGAGAAVFAPSAGGPQALPSVVRLLEIRSSLLVRLFDFLIQRKQRLDLSLGIMSDAQLLASSI